MVKHDNAEESVCLLAGWPSTHEPPQQEVGTRMLKTGCFLGGDVQPFTGWNEAL